jgi:hypothetical protein
VWSSRLEEIQVEVTNCSEVLSLDADRAPTLETVGDSLVELVGWVDSEE